MKKVFLCAPHKLGELNHQLIKKIEGLGFESPQDTPFDRMFETNVELIKKSDIFVAVLKDYGKDLTAEVGMAYAWGMPRIGIDYNAKKEDVMCYYAFEKVIKPDQLEEALKELK